MYGAKGDGVTDDTEAFEQALENNNHVFVPEGNYLIKRSIDLSYKKSLVSYDNQNVTILFDGDDSAVLIGRQAVFRNINIDILNEYNGIVFDTNNLNMKSNSSVKHSRVEHVRVKFSVESPKAILIGITVDSGTDANNIPISTGDCYQIYNDIVVDNSACYGIGIKMTLIEARVFTEETKTGFPCITHVNFNDIYLAGPYTAIKAGVDNTSGGEHFTRINMGHILFNNVSTQNISIEKTRYFLDVDHFSGYFSKCIGWDYHHITNDYNEKVNIIGEEVNLSFCDSEMHFGQELLKCCDFIAETESGFTVEESPEYFMNKYFNGSFLKNGYDSVDAKIDAKLADEYIVNIAEIKMNEILYNGYHNVLEDPSVQFKLGYRFSNSEQAWIDKSDMMAIIIPIVKGGNVIRWSPISYELSAGYQSLFFFNNTELTEGTFVGQHSNILVSDDSGTYLKVDNPSGYKYLSIPFELYTDISFETMIITINREINDSSNLPYVDYIKQKVVTPTVEELIINNIEEWVFTLSDGSTITKKVVVQ